jgi:glucose-6-phosphate 1-epimerase
MLWNDNPPQTHAADWAHGGIPLCWPWFGVDTNGVVHGTAWHSRFDVIRRRDRNDRSEVDLLLTNSTARLAYRIVLTEALELGLETRNTDTNDIHLSIGFHPYFRVAERDRTFVTGVDGLRYEDDPSCPVPASGTWRGVLPMTNTIDRIFDLGGRARAVLRLVDPACGYAVVVESVGASDVNVWNPGAEKLCPGMVPGDEWRRFVCVEPIRVGTNGAPLTLAPGGCAFLKMKIRLATGK